MPLKGNVPGHLIQSENNNNDQKYSMTVISTLTNHFQVSGSFPQVRICAGESGKARI